MTKNWAMKFNLLMKTTPNVHFKTGQKVHSLLEKLM